MSQSLPVIGIGAGGHAKVMIAALLDQPEWSIQGVLDNDQTLLGQAVLGIPVLGPDNRLPDYISGGVRHAFIGIGTARSTQLRRRIWDWLAGLELTVIDTIAPTAVVSRFASTGSGLTCLAGAIVQAGASLGNNVLINTGAIVEHDCLLADHVHVASGATLAGGVTVDEGALIGAGARVKPGIHIGRNSVVGCGAVVVRDIEANTISVGNPATLISTGSRSWMIPTST